ncbi:MAG: pseudouridine synthase [Pedosphaera sp.]|nr:pseudouridine synthase [Pedosphaera sp.]
MLVRLQKFLADAGTASRRASEQFIIEGRVSVNGLVVRELGSKVDSGHDRVTFDGQPVKLKRKLYIALNKPRGYICSREDPEGRREVTDLLPKEWDTLYTVGRLDYNSEGLIFLTNDGEFSLHLTHPRYGVRKKYRVTVEGRLQPETLKQFIEGVYHDGERLSAERAYLIHQGPKESVAEMELAEGKNREVRRMFETQAITVKRLERIQIGNIRLGELPTGRWRTLSETEVRSLMSSTPSIRPAGAKRRTRRPPFQPNRPSRIRRDPKAAGPQPGPKPRPATSRSPGHRPARRAPR